MEYQNFDEKLMYMYTQTRFYDEDEDSCCEELIRVTQHITQEQKSFEFPTKLCLQQLEYLDSTISQDSFFDLSCFTATAPTSAQDDSLIEDGNLSPLQLPAQIIRPNNYNNMTQPVGPSSFLSTSVTPSLYKGYASLSFSDDHSHDSIPIMDTDNESSTDSSIRSLESRTVLIKLAKTPSQKAFIYSRPLTYISCDEGYDDNETDELESHCVFYPLDENEINDDEEDIKRHTAAIKIQSLWRGYKSRTQSSKLPANQRLVLSLAHLGGKLHRRQMNSLEQRISELEERVREEASMRLTFEKAMGDMAVVMDQQQKVLSDRLDNEIHMRELYENKINSVLEKIQPLESRLKKEVSARNKMEDMMTRVLDQMHESETARQQQQKEDAELRRIMQAKLDQALNEITAMKKTATVRPRLNTVNSQKSNSLTTKNTPPPSPPTNKASIVPSVRKSIVPVTNKFDNTPLLRRQQQQGRLLPTSPPSPLPQRPSVIPSNRRPMAATQRLSSINTTSPPKRPLLTRK